MVNVDIYIYILNTHTDKRHKQVRDVYAIVDNAENWQSEPFGQPAAMAPYANHRRLIIEG